ncbi:thioredoxin reductase [Terrisporobacter othiniensis]|uniref:Thioredoxin reductase n=1 Tax=Terrisporobacter othiniensis TaxID=1577792 RepID=A0A0B3VVX5_9FIRM|nr:FAD-dependent oxidoreductase [Terrisporobacter othiniensis]KHS56739.1 thioredoxin reductase [Terrisporobacter othiniensis]
MIYDLIIIGGGPAGISAGIYAGRAKLKTLVIEKENMGGQIKTTHEMVNYPGILQTTGIDYMDTLRQQALSFNVNFKEDEVLDLNLESDIKVIKTKKEEIQGRAIIFATGASPRKLGFKGEEEFTGRGVAYCATCDGEFFQGLDVFVIGGGYAAAEEALFLTKFAKKVRVVVRKSEFGCAKTIADKVKAHAKIEVLFNTELEEVGGEGVLQFAKFKNNKTGEIFEYKASKEDGTFGLFVFIGYKPQTELLKGKVQLDEQGYIVTNEVMETNLPGVYAAGDLRPKLLRQVVTAVADGAIAATVAEKYVEEQKHRLGIEDEEEIVVENKVEEKVIEEKVIEEKPVELLNINDKNRKSKLLNDVLRNQIKSILAMMEKEVTLVSIVDETMEKSIEFMDLILDMASLGEKLKVEIYKKSENPEMEAKINADKLPVVALLDENKNYSGVKFHGVPGGHELNSFILAIYNLAGPGQAIDQSLLKEIKAFDKKTNIKVVVSLSCTLCPDVVVASQRLAMENENIEAEMVELSLFEDIKRKYRIMSVPAIIVNDDKIHFGAKKINEILDLISK